jgi:hypothetical protein
MIRLRLFVPSTQRTAEREARSLPPHLSMTLLRCFLRPPAQLRLTLRKPLEHTESPIGWREY